MDEKQIKLDLLKLSQQFRNPHGHEDGIQKDTVVSISIYLVCAFLSLSLIFSIINLSLSLFPSKITQIKVTMPNKHYYGVDLSKFPDVGSQTNEDVFLPIDKPSGNISGTLGRKITSKL